MKKIKFCFFLQDFLKPGRTPNSTRNNLKPRILIENSISHHIDGFHSRDQTSLPVAILVEDFWPAFA